MTPAELPDITLILGPQSRAALALNACLRGNAKRLAANGLTIFPSRLASPVIRRALDSRPEKERLEEFAARTRPRPIILSSVNMFGPPNAGLTKGELFPDAEATLAGLDRLVSDARIVVAIDPLPAFFLATGSGLLEERVRRTTWEVLYELSWCDLLQELVHLLPETEFLVTTSDGLGRAGRAAIHCLLGPAADDLNLPKSLLYHQISETGRAVLDRVSKRGQPDDATLADLYNSFALRPSEEDVKERLGIDRVTNALLYQRFDEDISKIAGLDRVEII